MASLAQDDWAQEHFARVITTEEVVTRGVDHVRQEIRRVIGDGPAYLSFDLDAIDPAYAPAMADPEVDGLTTREVMQILHGLRGVDLMGADVVCFCPPLDNPSQITALTASLLLLEFVSLIADYRSCQG
jgi:guanidinopropionase